MKKNLLYLMIMFGMMLLFPISAKALTGTVTIECAKSSISAGESTTCTIYATPTDGAISAVAAKYSVSSNLAVTAAAGNSDFTLVRDFDNGSINCSGDVDFNSKIALGTITVKANSGVTTSEETITISEIVYTDENSLDVNGTDATATINIVEKSTKTVPESEQKGKGVVNPKTADKNIMVSAIIIVGAAIISIICYRKFKRVN